MKQIIPGTSTRRTEKGLLQNNKLNSKARELDILPELKHNSMLSVCKLSDTGCTTVFHSGDGGVTVHWSDDIVIKVTKEVILRGWRDGSGLWRVPIKDEVENEITDTLLYSLIDQHQNMQCILYTN